MGLPIFESDEAAAAIAEGDTIEVDADSGLIRDLTTGRQFQARPIPLFMQELIADGGLMEHIRKSGGI
jgi:3-isopropylmalate/(R)-2-methylmalate dehydratase small subunit